MKWFKKSGWFYVPVSLQGWIIFALFLFFALNVFWQVDKNSHSVSDTLYGIFPFVIPAFLLLDWIASKTSK